MACMQQLLVSSASPPNCCMSSMLDMAASRGTVARKRSGSLGTACVPTTCFASSAAAAAASSPSSSSSSFFRKFASAPSNGCRIHCMQVVNPCTNKRFETLSYVPALSDEQIAKQVDYIILKGWIPCLEFDHQAVLSKENSKGSGYYDGRYWTLWKLPMFGCMDAAAVLREIDECKKNYPNAYIRLMAFDNKRQTQVVAVVVHKPNSSL